MLRFAMKFIDKGAKFYEAQFRRFELGHLKWRAAKLRFQVIEIPAS